ncbi:hypothetical protein NG796_15645 [Laspinema sp. A4]|uniref:hypothetical protein n=1 Tax=Laspinema sp. D2d TaxID=2953686 RepID=UPI0021BB20C9|nr:hypothetical protein [Laspinema sp. D2d]MCT7984732.1 hypothetical protein [Laspinema sp. D2d]
MQVRKDFIALGNRSPYKRLQFSTQITSIQSISDNGLVAGYDIEPVLRDPRETVDSP